MSDKHLDPHKAAERRSRYMELRRGGLDKWSAAREVGVFQQATIARYERWFQAVKNGEQFLRDTGLR